MNAGVVIGGSHVYSREQALENRIAHAIEAVVHRPAEGVQRIDRIEISPDANGNILVDAGVKHGRKVFLNTTAGRLAAYEYIRAHVLDAREAAREPSIPEELG